MNVLIIYLFICVCCIVQLGSDGRKIYTDHNLPDDGTSESYDSIYRLKKGVDSYFKSKQYNKPSRNKHFLKINIDEQKTSHPKSSVPNIAVHSTGKDYSKTYKTLEMETGEHIVKVKSELDTKSLSPQGGYAISVNPKYSHVIEIIRRGHNVKQLTPTGIKNPIEKQNVNFLMTDDPTDTEKFGKTDKPIDFEVFANIDDPTDYDDFSETDYEEEFKKADSPTGTKEFAGSDKPSDTEEPVETGELISEEFSDKDDTADYDEFAVTDFEEFTEAGKPSDTELTETDVINSEEFVGTDDPSDYEEFTGTDDPMDYEEFTGTYDPIDYEEFAGTDDPIEYEEFANVDNPSDYDEFSEIGYKEFKETYGPAEIEDFAGTDDTADYDEFTEAGNPSHIEELAETDGIDSEEFAITKDPTDYEGFTEANNPTDTNDFPNTDKPKDTEEFSENNNSEEISQIDSEAVINVSDSTISAKFVENSGTTDHEEMDIQHIDSQESAFNDEIEGSGEAFSGSQNDTSKSGRLLGIFSPQNETSPNCTTPKGEAGHCRRISQCLLSDALNNFNVFLQHLCLIRGALVGVCCPDNPVIEISNEEENTTEIIPEEIKQPPEGCGLNTKTRIVGGSISAPHEWTWMVALMKRNRFYCGGVIINNWYILTAAHCVLGTDLKDIAVRLGEYDFNENSRHTEDISISEVKRHAKFVTLTFQHDIALLKLRRSIKYSKFVGSICLPEQTATDYVDVKGTVVGWGTVSFGGSASPILRQVTIPVWKNEDCDRAYLLENISDSFMCAGSPEKGEDACQGDSGGPLMALNDKGRWEVIGIVSWGRRCGDPTYPGVYTRVTTYLDWIQQNAN